jgi:hypothetical protein
MSHFLARLSARKVKHVVPWLAYSCGLLPLVWCALHRESRREYWWVAVAFGISFLADTAVLLWGHPWVASAIYPVSQTAIIGAVFLPRIEAMWLTLALMVAALVAIAVEGMEAPHLLLHGIAWSCTTIIVWEHSGPLRMALLLAFGINLVPWTLLSLWPTWGTWGLYQSVRVLSLGWFCYAQADRKMRLA